MATKALTPETHDETVQDGIVLIDFWAEWCGPCRQFGPVFERVSEANPDATFVKVDTEAEPELAARYGVSSIPMRVASGAATPVSAQRGARPQPAREDLLKQVRDLDMD